MKVKLKQKLFTALVLSSSFLMAQNSALTGTIKSNGRNLEMTSITLNNGQYGTYSDENGYYQLSDIPSGKYLLEVSSVGYISVSDSVILESGSKQTLNFDLKEDVLMLDQVVITGSRNTIKKHQSAVIVNTLSPAVLEATQSLSIAEGLNFTPGLRIENNCQNCGFTQLRMNGLDGPYSQILINSRPIFSALAGVYGLEMLPANMVDRIEVVRGGGSVMYGGNAIAGTINIITKDPFENSFEIGLNQSLINGESSDRTINYNAALVSEDMNKGVTLFGLNRNRDFWDANRDGFSEIVELTNNTFGFDAFYNINDRNKFKLGSYFVNEYRRGGNKFDLFPHQTDVTEQLEHNIISSNASFETISKNKKHKLSLYGSIQTVNRNSYYGGGGRVIAPGDILTDDDILAINAYGESNDISTVSGIQYNYRFNQRLSITSGSEYIFNEVIDKMPGYERTIDQQVGTWGTYAELNLRANEKLNFLFGGRFDYLDILGDYDLASESFDNNSELPIFVPRITAKYNLTEKLKLRASFAQGYRGPQAFDEDLHIETVGGAARFIRINNNLEVERSNSALLSINFDQYVGKKQMNFVIEGFYTMLDNPFIYVDQIELDNGIAVIDKRNGAGATVSGVNIEANIAFSKKFILQSGATLQTALYDETEELWAPEDANDSELAISTDRLLRTPNAYGYFSTVFNPNKKFSIAYSGTITGSMDVAHVINPETEQTVIKETPLFFDNNLKISYTLKTKDDYRFEFFTGVQNILNAYQDDFDTGADRDAGYVYGPLRPRTFFGGIKFGLK